MSVSIVLVSFNTKDLTRNCLKSVYEKTDGLDFDIFVVDNASTDGSAEMIKEEFPHVKLIESKENLGFGNANNLAISQSVAKYIFLLNTDTILINNAVKILFDFMEKPENKNVGACGGQLFDENMKNNLSYNNFPTLPRLIQRALGLNFKDHINKLIEKNLSFNKNKKVEAISGADLMLRKSVLDEIGYFDKRFFLYFEEIELLNRMKKKGFVNMFLPEAKIIHFEGATCKKAFNDQLEKEKLIKKSELLFFKIAYGKQYAKIAKFFYQIYYFRYWITRFFARKFFERLKMVSSIEILN